MPYAFAYGMGLGDEKPYLTIDRQKQAVESYYCRHLRDDFDWTGIDIDAADSQRLPVFGRPAGGVLFDRTGRGDHVVISSIRVAFYRSADLIRLLDCARGQGVTLHFVEENIHTDAADAAGLLVAMLHTLGQVSDEPRHRAIRAGLAKRRERGLPSNGESPLGRKMVGKKGSQRLVDDPEELAQMQQIYEWRMQGMVFEEIYWSCDGRKSRTAAGARTGGGRDVNGRCRGFGEHTMGGSRCNTSQQRHRPFRLAWRMWKPSSRKFASRAVSGVHQVVSVTNQALTGRDGPLVEGVWVSVDPSRRINPLSRKHERPIHQIATSIVVQDVEGVAADQRIGATALAVEVVGTVVVDEEVQVSPASQRIGSIVAAAQLLQPIHHRPDIVKRMLVSGSVLPLEASDF